MPLPGLTGRFQIDNAGAAVAIIRALGDERLTTEHITEGLRSVQWSARLQRLPDGLLHQLLPSGAELWLDGGHNPAAGQALAQSLADLDERVAKPLVLVLGMLNTKSAVNFIAPFVGLATGVVTVTIPDELNALGAQDLAAIARGLGLDAEPADTIEEAISMAGQVHPAPRVLVCGSLYFAGHALALHAGKTITGPSGASKR